MKDEFVARIGVWGCGCPVDTSAEGRSTDQGGNRDRRHYNYLKKHSPTVINVMRLKGTLEQYLTDFDRDTQEIYDLLIRQCAEKESVRISDHCIMSVMSVFCIIYCFLLVVLL